MKKVDSFLICICLLGFTSLEIQAVNSKPTFVTQKTEDLPPSYDEIVLLGDLAYSAGLEAIEAGYNKNSLYIQFNQNFGYVNVTLNNTYGQAVYTDVVNTAVQQQVAVPISGLVNGVYTIVLENVTSYAEGDFEKLP